MNTLPALTHLQFLVIRTIQDSGSWATDISSQLGISGPKFYQAIRRMIDAGLIKKEMKIVHGRRTAFYLKTKPAKQMLQESVSFYSHK